MNYREYENEIDEVLIESFYPYSKLIKENEEAVKESYEVINRPIKPIVSTEEINALREQGVNCNIRSIVL